MFIIGGKYYLWAWILRFSFFAKTVKPVLEYLRGIGLRATAYVDDFLLGAPDKYIVDA